MAALSGRALARQRVKEFDEDTSSSNRSSPRQR
jgi:hypothetical protein